jgi:1,4-dihydroxy-2-naphthoate octaprenyltransferase
MTTTSQWIAGARPRTLPAAIVPVAIGTATAGYVAPTLSLVDFWFRALLALIVSLALQVGVNYANDYSDGIRGTDEVRVGPVRLVGQRLASPGDVKRAALLAFAVAALAGMLLILLTQAWWLIIIGLLAIAAGWFYTGGPRPYGYAGMGEIFVFVFFGVVAVTGTTFVITERIEPLAVVLSVAVGLLACALLVINNLRDIPGDTAAGKHTLAVRLGDPTTRKVYGLCLVVPFGIVALVGLGGIGLISAFPAGCLITVVALPACLIPWRAVAGGARGPALIPVLVWTGRIQLMFGLLLTVGIVASNN